jgi:DNA-directed RNA polymerase specialized sigma24 family protein
MTNKSFIANELEEHPTVFNARFWRGYRILHFIACRILGGPERAERAVENCWHTASRRPPRFESEGEFRSWLLRVLIDEALLLQEDQQSPTLKASGIPAAAEMFRREAVHGGDDSIRNDDQHLLGQGFSVALE